MDSTIYNSNTFQGINHIYADPTVSVNKRLFFTEQNMNLVFPNMLSGANDVKINNFSNLYLTDRKRLTEILSLKPLSNLPNYFTSHLAFNSVYGLNSNSLFWTYQNVQYGESGRVCAIATAPQGVPINENIFEIRPISETTCEIHHNYNNSDYLLTLDATTNLSFAPRFDLVYINGLPVHPQVFYYVYDQVNNFLILYKKIFDFPYYVSFSNLGRLALKQPPLGSGNSFPVDSIIALRPHVVPPNSFLPDEFSAQYSKSTLKSTLDTDEVTSVRNVKNNYLVNAEYSNITGSNVTVNILSLKNELSPQNNNADVDPYIQGDDFTYRDYQKLFTGTNQVKGSENIILSYTGFTSMIEFKPNAITYFHVPTNTFPYTRLNINDSNIASKGAVAGDHPLKSDKIFKKKADYQYYSYSGNSTDENNGTFLCSWLSGSPGASPIWVDRYYNPQRISFYEALNSTYVIDNSYTSEFNSLTNNLTTTSIVFDTVSNLFLEKGVYYAYHHIGGTDLVNYVNLLSSFIVQQDLVNYYVNDTQLLTDTNQLLEYSFNGQEYSQTIPLTALTSNTFTLAFDINVSNWRSDFAYQLIGNHTDIGFGIFNQTYITPYIVLPQNNTLNIINNHGQVIDQVTFESPIRGLFRKHELKPYHVLLSNGTMYKLAANHLLVSQANTTIADFSYVTSTFYNKNSAVAVVNTISANQIVGFDFTSETFFIPSSSSIITLNSIPISSVKNCTIYNNKFYCTSAYKVRLYQDNIFYKQDDSQIRKWNLTTNTDYPYFSAASPINVFGIDKDGNFYVSQDNALSKYDSTRQLISKVNTYNSDYNNVDIDFAGEFSTEGYQYNVILTQQASNSNASGTQVIKINSSTGVISNTLSLPQIYTPLTVFNITNGDYCTREIYPYLTANSLTVRATLPDILDRNKTTIEITQSISGIDTGVHNIAVRFDSIQGQLALFIDGINYQSTNFTPGQYTYSFGLMTPFTIGATPFFNNSLLSQYLKGLYFYAVDTKISNLRIYSKALNDSDITAIANSKYAGNSMLVNLPAGKRNLNDEIERFFKLDVPISKSSGLNISLVNSGISDTNLRNLLTAKILAKIQDSLPYNVSVNNIDWTE